MLRVLDIDDNPDDRMLTARVMERAIPEVQVIPIASPEAFAAALAAGAFDVAVTDFQLHWATGLDTLRQLKARYPDRPVLMFTNTASQEEAVAAMKEGLDDYIVKAPKHFIRLPSALLAAIERANARRQADAALAAREDFLTCAAHEIRTPLTVIHASLQTALARLDQVQAAMPEQNWERIVPLRQVLARALNQSRRLDRLVDDISEAVRLDASTLALQPRPVDMVPIVREAVADQHTIWPGRTLTLRVPAEAADVMADPDRLRLVLDQLLGNAIKFSEPATTVEVAITHQQEWVTVAVTDHGPGIPADALARVWDRFYRVPGISHQDGSGVGLGLGLAIVKSIVEALGGHVDVESVVGQGATFAFSLPRLESV
jgi:signal transduction histidine kinase